MLKSAAVSLETIKLQLIENRQFVGQSEKEFQLSKDAIKYLIKALEYADTSFTQEIETVLTKSGEVAIPALIKGLTSPSMNVKSTCSMVLIRLGDAAVEAVTQFHLRNAHKANLCWIAEFILDQLGEPFVKVQFAEDSLSDFIADARSLEKVG